MHQISIIYTTISTQQEAEKLAEQAIADKYAACVNIIPGAISIYEWEGKIEKSTECLMIFKTTRESAAALCDYIHNKHPYSIPAILQGNIDASNDFYNYIQTNSKIPCISKTL
jgi:periplasmic divalent cation tolerance protein